MRCRCLIVQDPNHRVILPEQLDTPTLANVASQRKAFHSADQTENWSKVHSDCHFGDLSSLPQQDGQHVDRCLGSRCLEVSNVSTPQRAKFEVVDSPVGQVYFGCASALW